MRFFYVKRVHSKVLLLFTVNVTILNRFATELPFIYLSNCISLSESRGNISLVGSKCGADHIPYLRPTYVYMLCGCATKHVRMVALGQTQVTCAISVGK